MLRLLVKHSAWVHVAHPAYTDVASPITAPAKTAGRMHADYARLQSLHVHRINLLLSTLKIYNRKGGDTMLKINFMSTLFVGIDVSSKSNVVYAMDFHQEKYIQSNFSNNQSGAEELSDLIRNCMLSHIELNTIVIAMESTSVYNIHIANHLSTCESLLPFSPYVYCLNPKMTANYRKSFIGMSKTDALDAYIIADFARIGRIHTSPWRGSQYLALKRLTRHRLHLMKSITREKSYMVSNLYLKFSELQLLENDEKPFSNIYGATSSAILTEYLSPQEILDASEEELLLFIAEKSKNKITDISKTIKLLKKAASDSYRLDQRLYEPLNISIASSFNCIEALKKEINAIDSAIEKTIRGLFPNALLILKSIDGIGPVLAAGIIAEIGDVQAFHSSDALAKYAGLTWASHDSGQFISEDTHLQKAGNSYLRYYLGEAANSVRRYVPQYQEYYAKKYNEVSTHQHKRALALTSRKFVRLVFGLLVKNQLYTGERLDTELHIESN